MCLTQGQLFGELPRRRHSNKPDQTCKAKCSTCHEIAPNGRGVIRERERERKKGGERVERERERGERERENGCWRENEGDGKG